jgi:hypothetical protein
MTTTSAVDESEAAFQQWKEFAQELLVTAGRNGIDTKETAWYVERTELNGRMDHLVRPEVQRLAAQLVAQLCAAKSSESAAAVRRRDGLPRIVG